MQFDPTFSVSNLLALVTLTVSLATALYSWLANRRTDVDEKFKDGSKRMAGLELRVQKVEHEISTTPRKDDMHALHLLLSEQSGELKAIRTSLRALNESTSQLAHSVTRHEDYLRENS